MTDEKRGGGEERIHDSVYLMLECRNNGGTMIQSSCRTVVRLPLGTMSQSDLFRSAIRNTDFVLDLHSLLRDWLLISCMV